MLRILGVQMLIFLKFANDKSTVYFLLSQMKLSLTSIIAAFLCLAATSLNAQNTGSLKLNTVVLDPGHGGNDPGAVSRDGKTTEKELTLKIAKLLGNKINAAYPLVKVVYTRTDDRFIPLDDRAVIANKNKANLFISIHINSFDNATPDGYSTHILGESSNKKKDLFAYNMNVCKKENSVIMLEDDYSTKYQGFDPNNPESFIFFHLMQNAFYEQSLLFAADVQAQMKNSGPLASDRGIHQDPFYVLWKTTMPAVLIENGFISNPKDLAVLRTSSGLEKIAESIFKAFSKFKTEYDKSTDIAKKTPEAQAAPVKQETKPAEKPVETKPVEKPVETKPAEKPIEVKTEQTKPAETKPVEKPVKQQVKTQTTSDKSSVRYGIQISASVKELSCNDPFFKKLPITRYKSGKLFKYIAYEQDSLEAVRAKLSEVKKYFGDCFIAQIKDGQTSFYKAN